MGRDERPGREVDEAESRQETARQAGGASDEHGQTAESDAQGKVASKTDERSPAEGQAEANLLKTSGGDPFTQESD